MLCGVVLCCILLYDYIVLWFLCCFIALLCCERVVLHVCGEVFVLYCVVMFNAVFYYVVWCCILLYDYIVLWFLCCFIALCCERVVLHVCGEVLFYVVLYCIVL